MRLREFLAFVGNEVVLHGVEDLPEKQIGVAVFDRPSSYDTSQDNIVRVNAMELRRRIDLYFATEGRDEPLIFEIPRGSYVPVFRVRPPNQDHDPTEESIADSEPASELRADSTDRRTPELAASSAARAMRSPLVLAWMVLSLCLAGWAMTAEWRIYQAQATMHKWRSEPALREFWGNFFRKGLAPEIVIADSSFALAQEILHRKLTLAEYLDYSYRATQPADPLSTEARKQQERDLAAIFKRSYGSIADFRVARRITELETGMDGTRLIYAREYAGHRLRWNNTIFVGSKRSNPWVELYEDRMQYHFREADDGSPSAVIVDNPRGNEPAEYKISSDPANRTAYCIVVFIPNPTNSGNTLILAGSDSQATEAGGDFITSEDTLEKLRSTLNQNQTIPYFQALLQISSFNGTPLGSEILSYRVVKP